MEKYNNMKTDEWQAQRPYDEAKLMLRMGMMDKEVIALYTGLKYNEVDALDNAEVEAETAKLYPINR